MPHIPYNQPPLEVPVNDRVIGATVVKQKARFSHLNYQQTTEGKAVVMVSLIVSLFAKNEDGSFGNKLEGKGFSDYTENLIADNDTIVDAANGQVLYVRGMTDENFEEKLSSYGQPVMLQGDFFRYLADTQNVGITPMIIGHIEAANQIGKFN